MRVYAAFDLGFERDGVEHPAEFAWETGELPVPRRGDRIAFGELITVVDRVQYSCMDAGYIATRDHEEFPVKIDLWLRLTKATRQGKYELQEFHSILSELPSVTDLCVTGLWE
ncbi:hypothetical protein [Streptomyces sp. NPDC048142]|uniref:hypothetical protein n=1 Tax=Streptomyces sp. NPDC048142 TaxID=3365501 RepID=UPI0037143025